MARGGGGGGRGGGRSFGGSRHRGRHGRQASIFEIIFALIIGVVLSFAGPSTDTGYSESALESYCASQYDLAFSQTESYEDNVLLTIVVYEDRSDFAYMAWFGDHINDETFAYLRGDGTHLDTILEKHIQSDYANSLTSDLCYALRDLASWIDLATENGSHSCAEPRSENPSGFLNYSELELNQKLISASVESFRETTGIPLVLVVEDAEDIFG